MGINICALVAPKDSSKIQDINENYKHLEPIIPWVQNPMEKTGFESGKYLLVIAKISCFPFLHV